MIFISKFPIVLILYRRISVKFSRYNDNLIKNFSVFIKLWENLDNFHLMSFVNFIREYLSSFLEIYIKTAIFFLKIVTTLKKKLQISVKKHLILVNYIYLECLLKKKNNYVPFSRILSEMKMQRYLFTVNFNFDFATSNVNILRIFVTYGMATYSNFEWGFVRESVDTQPLCRLSDVIGSVTLIVPESRRANFDEISWGIKIEYSFIVTLFENLSPTCSNFFHYLLPLLFCFYKYHLCNYSRRLKMNFIFL